jgi:hypothetical protein
MLAAAGALRAAADDVAEDTRALVETSAQKRCWSPHDVPSRVRNGHPKEIPCGHGDAKGQDGAAQAGVRWPRWRFTDNGNGTVKDNLTALIWLQDTACLGSKTWADALGAVADLHDVRPPARDACNLDDKSKAGNWRLPNVKELQSLIDFNVSHPALPNKTGTGPCTGADCPFTNVDGGRVYWSSTTALVSPGDAVSNKAWAVDLDNGNTLPHFRWAAPGVSTSFHVWAVRGPAPGVARARVEVTGQDSCWAPEEESATPRRIGCGAGAEGQDGAVRAGVPSPTERFVDNRNGTVTDKATGLVWLKNAGCFQNKTWGEALQEANGLHDEADDDGDCALEDRSRIGQWRLPNVKELQSLIDFGTGSEFNVALPRDHPFYGVEPIFYWSSTTFAGAWDDALRGEPDDAWAVSLRVGLTLVIGNRNASEEVTKNQRRGAWPVRGGVIERAEHE